MEEKIHEFLIKEKIPRSLSGFGYMCKIIKMLCIDKRWQKIELYKIYNRLAKEEGITGYGIRRGCQYAKEVSKSYPNMTMKEWFCWAAIECSNKRRE